MFRPRLVSTLTICLFAILAASPSRSQASRPLPYRWVWMQTNLLPDENIPRVESIMRRAAKVGYTGIVLSDSKFNILDRMFEPYFKHVEQIKALAKELKLEIIPTVFDIGYSEGILAHDPNLVEGLPVKDAPFVARGGKAEIVQDEAPALRNGGFEEARGDSAVGWSFQDAPGKNSFIDRAEKHSGSSSLRFEGDGTPNPEAPNWRVNQKLALKPWRYYRLSFWVRTRDLANNGAFNVILLPSTEPGRNLSHLTVSVKPTQDWEMREVTFNSLGNTDATAYIGLWGAKKGAFWLDDVKVEELGPVNVVRRAGCPFVVKGEDGTVYTEGQDYAPVKDPKMGMVPYIGNFELYHPAPPIILTVGSRIREGQRVRVSFYHPAFIYGMQTACCLTDPKVYDILRDQMQRVEKLFHPTAVLMSHDEIRIANWCETCQATHKTPGQLLADNVRHCIQIVKQTSPRARIYTWNDMFDPYHNATESRTYFLVNGSWTGSWEGLTPEVGIVNWYFEPRKKNLPFFANRGHKQILAGYYDNNVEYTKTWLDDGRDVKGIVGVMYTTWQSKFDDLEKFAQVVWGGKPVAETAKR
jgi:hypothetical protein